MKKTRKILALILAVCAICCLPIYAMADSTIDQSKTASLSIYDYDLTRAEADGAWNTSAYVSTGQHDDSVMSALAEYAVPGVGFTYVKLADVGIDYDGSDVNTLYGFTDTAFLTAIGLSTDAAQTQNGSTYYFGSDAISIALAAAIANNSTNAKNTLESYIKTAGTAMPLTDENGHTSAADLELGLYLVVQTSVPENVSSTCDPFLVALPMTSSDGSTWNYDVEVYPKSRTGLPTLTKSVREAVSSGGKSEAYAPSASASAGDTVEYQIVSTLPSITSNSTALSRYSFVDNLASGIAYKKGDVLITFYKDAACTQKITEWNEDSGKFNVNYAGQSMIIDMTEAGLSEINTASSVYGSDSLKRGYSDCTMRISYGGTLASDTSLICGDAGNPNTVQLTWARSNPNETATLSDHAHVYSYALDLTKRFEDGQGDLSKVRFVVYNDTDKGYIKAKQMDGIYYVTGLTSDKSLATEFIPTSAGKILIVGLENDSYTATEIATAAEYNLLRSPIRVVINGTNGAACSQCGKATMTASATVNGKAVSMTENHAKVPMTVTNTKGFALPQTGSYGTWMFTIGGLIVMGLAAFAIFRLSRKRT